MSADVQGDAADSGDTSAPAGVSAKVQRRTIALGVALGFVAAGVVGGALVVAGGDSGGGGRSERIADVEVTTTVAETTSTTVVATTAPGPVASEPGGGGTSPAAAAGEPVPLDQQVADHEVRITELEQAPATTAPAPASAPTTVPIDPPRAPRPPAPPCEGQLQWSDVQGWICVPPPGDQPVVP